MKSESIVELAKALCKVQAVIENAKKDAANPFFKSHYADLSSVWEVARKPLTDNGLSVSQLPGGCDGNKIKVRTILMHTSGEWLCSEFEMPFLKLDPQSVGSAITYARRYALAAIIGIVADEDDDGNKASGKTEGEEPKKPQPEQKSVPPKKDDVDYRSEITRMLTEMWGGDEASMGEALKSVTGFQGKNGWVDGTSDVDALKDKRNDKGASQLTIAYQKVKKEYEEWQKQGE